MVCGWTDVWILDRQTIAQASIFPQFLSRSVLAFYYACLADYLHIRGMCLSKGASSFSQRHASSPFGKRPERVFLSRLTLGLEVKPRTLKATSIGVGITIIDTISMKDLRHLP
jgi:hypothetical protein